MMIRKKSNPWARAKYLYVLPLAAVTMAAFARPEISQPLEEISSVKVNDLSAVMKKYADKNVSTTAEKATLKMKVVDEKGKPVSGATVLIANTTKGTVTDTEGNFTLEAETDQQLQVAYIGMGTVTLSVADCLKKTDQTIRLTTDDEEQNGKVVPPTPQAVVSNNQTFDVVEQMPAYPGGMKECLNFLAQNLRYPAKAQEAGKQGRVIVQFVVRKDGSLSDFHILRSVDPWLDAEAIRVIGTMPKWTPGMQGGQAVDVKYTLPVTFKLESNNKLQAGNHHVGTAGDDTALQEKLKGRVENIRQNDSPAGMPTIGVHENDKGDYNVQEKAEHSPLVILDDTEVSNETMKKLDPENIESITVLKDVSATAKYGQKGKYGVILITTRKK